MKMNLELSVDDIKAAVKEYVKKTYDINSDMDVEFIIKSVTKGNQWDSYEVHELTGVKCNVKNK